MNTVSAVYDRLCPSKPEVDIFNPDHLRIYIREEEELEPLLQGAITILTGPSGCGKSAFATALVLASAAEEPFAGVASARAVEVHWFSAEEDRGERYALLLHRQPFEERRLPFLTHYGPLPLDNEENMRRFLRCFGDQKARIAVLDPLPSFVSNPALLRDLVLTLKRISVEWGVQFLATTWPTSGGLCGGVGVRSAASGVWELRSENEGMDRLLSLATSGRAYPEGKTYRFRSSHPLLYQLLPASSPPPASLQELVLSQLSTTPRSAREIATSLGKNPDSVRNILSRLATQSRIIRQGKKARAHLFTRP